MKKEYVVAILFFSGLWGIAEAALGGALYSANVPYASVPLSVIGFVVLTFARVYFPQVGTATLIAACAMLYKFLNEPFFACHLSGILIMGICYDVCFGAFGMKSRWLCAVAATYLSHAVFALTITYVFAYGYWAAGGFSKVLGHIAIVGSMAALACSFLVPLSFRLGERLKASCAAPFALRLRWDAGAVSAVALGLWVFSVTTYFLTYLPVR